MRRYLSLLILIAIFSCKKSNDPAPDLTRDLIGVYQAQNSQVLVDDISVTIKARWTIDKISDKKIRLTHDEETIFEGDGWEEYTDPIPPKKIVFDNIELTDPTKFHVTQKVQAMIDDKLQYSNVEITAELAGKHLNANIKETFETGGYQADILMKRQ